MAYGKTDEESEKDDKRNLVALRSGTGNQRLIDATYQSARVGDINAGGRIKTDPLDWVGMVEKGMQSFTAGKTLAEEKFKIEEETEKTEREELLKDIKEDSDKILNGLGGSLDPVYFEKAYKHVESIRKRYITAVEDEDDMEMAKIKAELNGLAATIGQTKDGLTAAATTVEEGNLTTLSNAQMKIRTACVASNSVIDKDGIKWKNPDFGKTPGKGVISPEKKFFTMADYNAVLVEKDHKYKEEYITKVNSNTEKGINFMKGEGEDFDYVMTTHHNKSSITEDNIQYLLNDNFVSAAETGETFAASLEYNPQLIEFFKGSNEVIVDASTTPQVVTYPEEGVFSEENYNSLKNRTLYDKNKDGVVTWQDFASTKDEAMKMIKESILQPDSKAFNFEISQDLLAEWMTLRQKKSFYNGSQVDASGNPNLTPEDFAAEIGYDDFEDKEFTDAGGSIGYMKSLGWSKVEKKDRKKRSYNPPRFKWVERTPSTFEDKTKY